MKSIPTSTSTFPQSLERKKVAAQNTAQMAFRQSRVQAVMMRGEGQKELLTTPKLRRKEAAAAKDASQQQQQQQQQKATTPEQVNETVKDINQQEKTAPEGVDDIGDLSRTRDEVERDPELLKTAAARAGGPKTGGVDSFVVWCTREEPSVEKKAENNGPVRRRQPGGVAAAKMAPKAVPVVKPSIGQEAARILWGILQTAWWFVEPVFDLNSGIRGRWEQHRVTWQDITLFVAAASFTAGVFLLAIVFARVTGMLLQIVRMFLGVFKVLTGF